jgi:hypothetical protein
MRAVSLVAAAAFALAVTAGSALAQGTKEHQFTGAAKCKTCHRKEPIGNQYAKWLDSKHAKAYETLAGDDAKKIATEKGIADPQKDDKCLKCHVTGHGVAKKRLGPKHTLTEGVSCEACHGAGNDYRKKKIMMDEKKAQKAGLVEQTEKVCTVCHNDESPSWKPDKYTLASGKKVGFDYEQAKKEIEHPVPEGYEPGKESDEESEDEE